VPINGIAWPIQRSLGALSYESLTVYYTSTFYADVSSVGANEGFRLASDSNKLYVVPIGSSPEAGVDALRGV
jgi:hypothetical protein